jgi:hypothetical protein
MPMVIDCPSCNRKLNVPESLLGQVVKCPSCAATFAAATTGAQPAGSVPSGHPGPQGFPDDPADVPPARTHPMQPLGQEHDDQQSPTQRSLRQRPAEKPGKVQAIAIMTLVGGILATINALILLASFGLATMGVCCLWPGPYYGLVVGIMAIVKGTQLMGEESHRMAPPRGIAIMQIINIINLDVPNCVMGILTLIFLNEPETAKYFRG